MIVTNLRHNSLSADATGWYLEYLTVMDERDMVIFAGFLDDDVSIQFNNEPPVSGKPAVVAMLGAYWKTFADIEHDLINIYGTDEHFALEALDHYVRCDQGKVTTRAVAFTDRYADGKVGSIRLYADTAPVFA